MKNNKWITVLLIILVIVCVFQGCSIASMSSNMEELNNRLNQTNNYLENLEYRVEDLESVVEANVGIAMDYDYEVSEVDWDLGKVLAEYSVFIEGVTEDTRVLIQVGKERYELTYDGNEFKGTVGYPMDKNAYETTVYRYEGDMEKSHEIIETFGAGDLLLQQMSCKFDGFTAYGNGKLTVAGELYYGFHTSETVTEAHLVAGDISTDIKIGKEGTVPINMSEYVDVSFQEGMAEVRKVCMEFVTESGMTYRIYPYFSADGCYQIHRDEEMMEDGEYIYQDMRIVVTLPDGTTYEMREY